MPLLMVGGVFLCFEGYEKLRQMMMRNDAHAIAAHAAPNALDARTLEEETVAGAIRTDFILSAEIMAISLASIATSHMLMQALVLLAVGLLVTAGVYGLVAIIVKADDFGVYLAQRRDATTRAIGKVTVQGMPAFLKILSFVGTVAMLWVGGGIIAHGLSSYGIDQPQHIVNALSEIAGAANSLIGGFLTWLTEAFAFAFFGAITGAITALAVVPVLTPLWRRVSSV